MNKKINQDRCLCYYDEKTQSLIVGVFDGHGEQGHIISEVCILEYTTRNRKFEIYFFITLSITSSLKRTHWVPCMELFEMRKKLPLLVFVGLVDSLEHKDLCEFNGTTAIAAVIRDKKLFAMNIGDSRMFYAVKVNDKVRTESITTIHCPDQDIERKRIEQCGGKVFSLRAINSNVTMARVHPAGDDDFSGLAMSRSVCDAYFHRCGVISEPDLYEKELEEKSIGLLVGSDGLTTIFGMDHCFKQILEKEDPNVGLATLVDNCFDTMYHYSEREYVDDISGVYIEFCPTKAD